MSDPEPMDTEKVLKQLNLALELQLRSLLQFTHQVDWLRRARRAP